MEQLCQMLPWVPLTPPEVSPAQRDKNYGDVSCFL